MNGNGSSLLYQLLQLANAANLKLSDQFDPFFFIYYSSK